MPATSRLVTEGSASFQRVLQRSRRKEARVQECAPQAPTQLALGGARLSKQQEVLTAQHSKQQQTDLDRSAGASAVSLEPNAA